MLHAVVMAGGSGTRFWPLSRQNWPKHLLNLTGSDSLIQHTVCRVAPLIRAEQTWVITAAEQAAAIRAQLPNLPANSIIGEPYKRDTAPCIGLAAALIESSDRDAMMVVMPADHVIAPADRFLSAIETAAGLVRDDPTRLVTFGIKPARPATGYGYIQRGAALNGPAGAYGVRAFREKPTRELAEQFVSSGEFYWNSGIFIWSARTILDELRRSRPHMVAALERIRQAWGRADRDAVFEQEYKNLDKISIDYAVMEHAKNVVVIEVSFLWDDVGSWQAIERLRGTNPEGNTIVGMHCGLDTRGCIVVAESDRVVATSGIEDLIIVQSGNATLIADKRREESVKQLVELMRARGLEKFL